MDDIRRQVPVWRISSPYCRTNQGTLFHHTGSLSDVGFLFVVVWTALTPAFPPIDVRDMPSASHSIYRRLSRWHGPIEEGIQMLQSKCSCNNCISRQHSITMICGAIVQKLDSVNSSIELCHQCIRYLQNMWSTSMQKNGTPSVLKLQCWVQICPKLIVINFLDCGFDTRKIREHITKERY